MLGWVAAAAVARKRSPRRDATISRNATRSQLSKARCRRPTPRSDPGMAEYVLAIDQGTTSTRAIVFDHAGTVVVARHSSSTSRSSRRRAGSSTTRSRSGTTRREVIGRRPRKARPRARTTSPRSASPTSARPRWSGTDAPASRSTTRSSGRTPAPRPIVDRLAARRRHGAVQANGRPAAGHLLRRAQDRVDPRQRRRAPARAAEAGELLFGTTDTWLLWNLTGGANGGVHVTDVTNASAARC